MAKINYMTQEGLLKLRKELEQLTKVERPSISAQIAEARDKGDLSENAEYDAAKDAQGMLEMKFSQLEEKLANARIIDESKIDTESVQIMNKIKIRNKSNNTVLQYMIVSETEADLKAGKLSISTPIAQALLGKKLGDKVTVKVPSGEVEYEIVEISM